MRDIQKGSLTYRTGDTTAINERPAIIAHVCNDRGAWGAGFSGALSKRWPTVATHYKQWWAGAHLGDIQIVDVASELWVINMLAQHGLRRRNHPPPIRYTALTEALRSVAFEVTARQATLHVPRIGCGLAGGSWMIIEPILCNVLADIDVTVYDLPRTD